MEQIIAEVDSEVSSDRKLSSLFAPAQQYCLANLALITVLFASIAVWFAAIRTPLWLDETISYWQISAGFGQIWARQGLSFPAYTYILWAVKSVFGSSSFALRAPSIVAMLAAVYVLYRLAREFFSHDVSLIAAIIFSLHPVIVFAAIDARPYAFGVLVINATILCLFRWIRTQQTGYAIAQGICCGLLFYFQYLFGVLLPALLLVVAIRKRSSWTSFWPQIAKALVAFAIVMLPVIPRLAYLFRSRGTHVFAAAPMFDNFVSTIAPGDILFFLLLVLLVAAVLRLKPEASQTESSAAGIACLLLAFVPLTILYETSRATPLHVFVDRYRIVAVPGIALCWALLLRQFKSALRVAFCLTLLTAVAFNQFQNPEHNVSWRDAIAAANRSLANNAAPVLVCSDLPESDFEPLPADPLPSSFFAPFTYYNLNASIVPLSRTVTPASKAQIAKFLSAAGPAHQRFLAMGFSASGDVFRYLQLATEQSHVPHLLGMYNGVWVVELIPRAPAVAAESPRR